MFVQAEARYCWLEQRFAEVGFAQWHPHLAGLRAITVLHLGQQKLAAELAERALRCAADTGSAEAVATARCAAGEVFLGLGEWSRARLLLSSALVTYERWNKYADTANVIRGLVAVNEALGDIETAYELHKRLLEIELVARENRASREREIVRGRVELAASRVLSLRPAHRDEQADSAQLLRENQQLEQERRALERLAHTDVVTGLANRRYFDVQLTRMLVRAELGHRPLGLVIVDIDHFKQINDNFSHLAGDEVLRRVGELMLELARRNDLAARVGGEELAVLLPKTTTSSAMAVAERIRGAVAELDVSDICPDKPVTISAGVAVLKGSAANGIYSAADSALYQAKSMGRNRVCLAKESIPDDKSYAS